ncbi:MAG: hypothetical protein GTO03_00605, partial [Planctomycetales bacterium]|nr:hypothetical protein [Planctomycetales bacterium]
MDGLVTHPPGTDNRSQVLESLIAAAVQAPSGDNCQPWRFAVDEDQGQIVVSVDPARDPSPMNAGQRMARIAVGAAIENIVRTAEANQTTADVYHSSPHAVVVQLRGLPQQPLAVPAAVTARHTNRRPYEGRPVAPPIVQALASQTPACPLVKTHWLVQPERIKQLAEIIAAADTILFNAACMRNGFLENVRFDVPPNHPVDQGLSLAALELKRPDALALRLMAHLPNRLLQWVQVGRAFAKPTRQLVHSAAGLCLGVAADHRPQTDFAVGRAMQRAWLALTEHQMAVQP